MYSTSTQKREWTYTAEEISELREKANQKFRETNESLILPEEMSAVLTAEEELRMVRILEDAAIKFSDSFHPPMWPSVRWTAYAYFKRLYLQWSVMDATPKPVMMACFYLAMKTDEFYVTIDEFVKNLKSGSREQNTKNILALEAEIMRVLKYHLTIHCPFRPFEGHLMEMKTKMLLLNFDLESVRQPAEKFFRRCLLGDAMLMYSPTHIALAGLKYGLDFLNKAPELLTEFLLKMFGIDDEYKGNCDEEKQTVKMIIKRLDEIIDCVMDIEVFDDAAQAQVTIRTKDWVELNVELEKRRSLRSGVKKRDEFDSDDD